MPRSFADRTSISGGIDFAVAQFARAPFAAKRRTIDVSGDGTNNAGRDVAQARDEALAAGITINGLVILSERPLPGTPSTPIRPAAWPIITASNVIGGPGAFVMEAKDFNAFRPGHHQQNDRRNRLRRTGQHDAALTARFLRHERARRP